MCGDGANDCNALNMADVGLSLSEAEASIAAPFTSKIPNIQPYIDLIKQGRCSLANAHALIKFMVCYCFIQFVSVTILYSIASNLGDFQYLYVDLFSIIPISLFIGNTQPYNKLKVDRPYTTVLKKQIVVSTLVQFVILGVMQLGVFFFLKTRPFFTPLVPEDQKNIESFENTTIFLFANFQYTLCALSFSIGKPFRRSLFSNWPLVLVLAIELLIHCLLVFQNVDWINSLFQLEWSKVVFDETYTVPMYWRWFILIFGVVSAALCYLSERLLMWKQWQKK